MEKPLHYFFFPIHQTWVIVMYTTVWLIAGDRSMPSVASLWPPETRMLENLKFITRHKLLAQRRSEDCSLARLETLRGNLMCNGCRL